MRVCSVLRCVCVMRIYSSIAKDLKFCWSIQVTWKQRSYSLAEQHQSWQIFHLLSFFIPVGAGGFTLKQIIVLFWVIIYSYLRKVFKIGVLKNLLQFTGKHLRQSFLLITQYFLIRDTDIDVFLRILRNCQEHYIYSHLVTPASVFLNAAVISLVLISQIGFSNHLAHS